VEPGETLFSLKGAEELPTYLFFARDEKMEMICSPLGGAVFIPGREPWGVPDLVKMIRFADLSSLAKHHNCRLYSTASTYHALHQ
jgi:hypothetical protein